MAIVLDLQEMDVPQQNATAARSDLSWWNCASTGSWVCTGD